MSDVELESTVHVFQNGSIVVYRVGDMWAYKAISGEFQIESDEPYVNRHCARANAMLNMEKEHGIKFRGVVKN